MAFPVVQTTSSGSNAITSSHAITLPSSIVAGDKLVVFFTTEGSPTGNTNTPSGWTKLAERTEDSGAAIIRLTIYTKIAQGSDTLTVTTDGSTVSAYTCYRIFSNNDVLVSDLVDGNSVNPNSPSFTPAGGSQKYLWISAICFRAPSTVSAYPANYTANQLTNTAQNFRIASAVRANETATEDPGAYTITSATDWVAATVAIEAQDVVMGTFAILTRNSTIFASEIDFAANATFNLIEMNSQIFTPVAKAFNRPVWTNESSNTTTWTNEPKSI